MYYEYLHPFGYKLGLKRSFERCNMSLFSTWTLQRFSHFWKMMRSCVKNVFPCLTTSLVLVSIWNHSIFIISVIMIVDQLKDSFCICKHNTMETKTNPWKFRHNLLDLDRMLEVGAIYIFVHKSSLPHILWYERF